MSRKTDYPPDADVKEFETHVISRLNEEGYAISDVELGSGGADLRITLTPKKRKPPQAGTEWQPSLVIKGSSTVVVLDEKQSKLLEEIIKKTREMFQKENKERLRKQKLGVTDKRGGRVFFDSKGAYKKDKETGERIDIASWDRSIKMDFS